MTFLKHASLLIFVKNHLQLSYVPFKNVQRSFSKIKWSKPDGYDTGINIYVPYIKKKVPLILKRNKLATWYMCGPTVYDDAHIGHASCYVKFDIIRRIMQKMFNIEVITLMGITDIDDKIIHKAQRCNCSINNIARKYERDFFQDMKMMNVDNPVMVTRVTDFISEIISFCEVLVQKDYAYVTREGNVYFSVPKVSQENDEDENNVLHVIEIDPLKKDPRDFVLWKTAKLGEPFWDSPWGKGRPGWHIECSAMASCVFGNHIDIHSGGGDLRFPHHTNENSQSTAYHNCEHWASYWIYAGILHIGEQVKMSKSLGNMVTVKDFLKENSANVFRIMCLQSTYRSDMDYSDESVRVAAGVHSKMHMFLNDSEAILSGEVLCPNFDANSLIEKFGDTRDNIHSAFADDFNTDYAIIYLGTLVSEAMKCLEQKSPTSSTNNLWVISAIASYIDEVLEKLGVCIVMKKKLPEAFLSCVDIIIACRAAIRQCALPVTKKIVETEKSFLPYLGVTNCKYLVTENKHSNFSTLIEETRQKLSELGIIFDDQNGFTFSDDHAVYSKDLEKILRAFSVFCSEVNSTMDILSHSKASSDQLTKTKTVPNNHAILTATDEFRKQLYNVGIGIKDTSSKSTWFPAVDHFVNISLNYKKYD